MKRIAGPSCRVSDSVDLEQGPRVCCSNKSSGDVDDGDPGLPCKDLVSTCSWFSHCVQVLHFTFGVEEIFFFFIKIF